MLGQSLAGIRVLDASRVLAGPFAGQILADLGAEVLKIEDTSEGDETRGWGPPFGEDGTSAYFASCNRGKKGVTLNLKTPRGRELLHALAAKCDIVLLNFRAASAAGLGATPEALLAANPKAVIVTLSGYGSGPAWGAKPGYDFAVQGISGMMAATGPKDGRPHKFGVAIADLVTGHYAAIAALAALRERDRSGQGLVVELALVDCAVATMANVAQAHLTTGKAPARVGNAHLQIVPYEMFETADGWLILAVGNDRQWREFCGVVAGPEGILTAKGAKDAKGVERTSFAPFAPFAVKLHDIRYARNQDRVRFRDELVPQIAGVMRLASTAAWRQALDAAGVPNGPVWTLPELFASDLATERNFRIFARRADGSEVALVRSPLVESLDPAPPPARGEHTDEVLSGILGLESGAIARLRAEGVV